MKPSYSILDESFRYVPAAATSVAETWRRFGWRPTTEEERKTRRRPPLEMLVEEVAAVTPFRRRIPSPLVASAVEREPVIIPKTSTG